MKKKEYERINWARFSLLLPVSIISCGINAPYGDIIRLFSGAATLCFFIFSGFLITQSNAPTEEKLLRAIRRTAMVALAMLVLNLIVNAIYIGLMGGSILQVLGQIFTSKRMLFEFVVMNIWHLPVGENFWFIQSLLYAYIVLYFWYKLGLQKLNWLLFIVTMAANIALGELAGVIHFSLLGYAYIPANFFTRALPYLLLGTLLRDLRYTVAHRNIFPIAFLALVPMGGFVTMIELSMLSDAKLLVYTGHFIGNAMIAVGICLYVIMREYNHSSLKLRFAPPKGLLRWCTTFVYGVHQPFTFLLSLVMSFIPVAIAQRMASMMVVPVLVGSLVLSLIGWVIYQKVIVNGTKKPVKAKNEKQETNV